MCRGTEREGEQLPYLHFLVLCVKQQRSHEGWEVNIKGIREMECPKKYEVFSFFPFLSRASLQVTRDRRPAAAKGKEETAAKEKGQRGNGRPPVCCGRAQK